MSDHANFYRQFGRPITKVFLGAVFVYQVAYWSWAKMESVDLKDRKLREIDRLQAQLKARNGDPRS